MKRQKCDVMDLDTVNYTKEDAATFHKLLRMQKALVSHMARRHKSKGTMLKAMAGETSERARLKYVDYILTCMSQEIAELRDYLPWKTWKDNSKYSYKAVEKEIKYEVIDILHFWLDLCLLLGMNGGDIVKYYFAKCWQNHQRQKKGY